MQSPGGESGEGERGESALQTEDGSGKAAEDREAAGPSAPENQSGPDDPSAQLHPDHSGGDDDSPAATDSVQENTAQAPFTYHLTNLNTSEDMEDQELLPGDQEEEEEEEEDDNEFIVLDSEHPLVRRQQAALNNQLSKQLERINLGLRDKLATEKADSEHLTEIHLEMFRIQEHLARLQTRLAEHHCVKTQAETKHQQTQEQLEAMKSQFSRINLQDANVKSNVSQLQAELDNLMLHLTFTQGVSEDLRSNVKALMNARRKAGAEKNQAEEQKLKQDLYVERLTKEMERLTQQISMYEVQLSAQAEETQSAKEALCEAEMELESLVMARKQLLQQWSSTLMGMRRRDEAFTAMQEAARTTEHEVVLLDREIEGYRRSITEAQEHNETLTMQLNRSQMNVTASKRLISQKEAQQEALHAHYSICLRTLKETEDTLPGLSQEMSIHLAEVTNQRKQLERESAVRLDIEDKIMTHIQQKLTHNKAAKYSQRLVSRIAALKKQKISQLWQLENEIVAVGLERSNISQHLDSLALNQNALNEEIQKYNNSLTSVQTKISSIVTMIGQKQAAIANFNKKICQITASTGHEDLSPLQIRIDSLKAQIEDLATNIKSDQRLWMRRQGTLVGLTQEIEANSKDMLTLQIEYTGMRQMKMSLESQVEVEQREEAELDKKVKMLTGDLLKLNSLLSKNTQISQALEQENSEIETDFLHRLKEAERDAIKMQMKDEKTREEKERILNSLVEAERQIMLWEKKTLLVKETRSTVEVGQEDIQMMKAEIHRMEVRLNNVMKQQERLLRESEATVARRETIVLRREALAQNSHRQTSKGELDRITQGLQRKIQDTHKHVVECEQAIRELQESQASLGDRLAQQKQQLIEVCSTNYSLDPDFVQLQDAKDKNLTHLVALQSRTKKLQAVREGSYRALSTDESVGNALQSQMERVHAISAILHCVCEEFPQHQGALRRPSHALEAQTQAACTQASERETARK